MTRDEFKVFPESIKDADAPAILLPRDYCPALQDQLSRAHELLAASLEREAALLERVQAPEDRLTAPDPSTKHIHPVTALAEGVLQLERDSAVAQLGTVKQQLNNAKKDIVRIELSDFHSARVTDLWAVKALLKCLRLPIQLIEKVFYMLEDLECDPVSIQVTHDGHDLFVTPEYCGTSETAFRFRIPEPSPTEL